MTAIRFAVGGISASVHPNITWITSEQTAVPGESRLLLHPGSGRWEVLLQRRRRDARKFCAAASMLLIPMPIAVRSRRPINGTDILSLALATPFTSRVIRAHRVSLTSRAKRGSRVGISLLEKLGQAVDEAAGKHITINATGAIGALLLEIGIPPEGSRGVAVLSRSAGFVGLVLEEQHDIRHAHLSYDRAGEQMFSCLSGRTCIGK